MRHAGPAQAGPAAQSGLALGDDGGRSLALALADAGAAGNTDRHERGDECNQKLFHRDPLCLVPLWLKTDAPIATRIEGSELVLESHTAHQSECASAVRPHFRSSPGSILLTNSVEVAVLHAPQHVPISA